MSASETITAPPGDVRARPGDDATSPAPKTVRKSRTRPGATRSDTGRPLARKRACHPGDRTSIIRRRYRAIAPHCTTPLRGAVAPGEPHRTDAARRTGDGPMPPPPARRLRPGGDRRRADHLDATRTLLRSWACNATVDARTDRTPARAAGPARWRRLGRGFDARHPRKPLKSGRRPGRQQGADVATAPTAVLSSGARLWHNLGGATNRRAAPPAPRFEAGTASPTSRGTTDRYRGNDVASAH